MIWEAIELWALDESLPDELGNCQEVARLIRACMGRATPWTMDELKVLPRDITRYELRLFVPLPRASLEDTKIVKYQGLEYQVLELISSSPRGCILRLKRTQV